MARPSPATRAGGEGKAGPKARGWRFVALAPGRSGMVRQCGVGGEKPGADGSGRGSAVPAANRDVA